MNITPQPFKRRSQNKSSAALIVTGVIIMISCLMLNSCDQDGEDPIINPGNISTIAGIVGEFDYSGDGGKAIEANLGWLAGVTIDPTGNIYFVDGAANVVRRIDRASGIITTVAGKFIGFNVTDPTPYAGDGGPATESHLYIPMGIATDASGNIYIIESGNSILRKIDASTGIISTIAGKPGTVGYSGDNGLATKAMFWNPYDVKVDQSGNIYIADAQNHAIRKITAATGIITTIAGSGTDNPGYAGDNGLATSAKMREPQGIALDPAGNLYIVDAGNHVVRKVDATSGVITTVAGTGVDGYDGDGGIATSARLKYPNKIAVDAEGSFYVTDQGNSVVRRVSASTGLIKTFAGTGIAGYSGDGGEATAAQLSYPQGIAIDNEGNVIFTESGSSIIRAVRP